MTTRAKRHHWVPQAYLRRFTASNGLLWMHDLERSAVREVAPVDALVEKYLYSPEVGDDPHDDEIERFLAEHVDGPAAAILPKLASGVTLTSEERERIAFFVAIQEMRVPKARDTVQGFIEQIGDRMLSILARPERIRRTFEAIGKEVSDGDVQRIVELVRSGQIKTQATKIPWFHAMGVATETAHVVHDLPWAIVRAPSGVEFVSSDAPVVKVSTDPRVPRSLHGGWLSPAAESTFPLDPQTCLALVPGGSEGVVEGTREWCEDVNRRTAHHAVRFLLSRRKEDGEAAIAAAPPRKRTQ